MLNRDEVAQHRAGHGIPEFAPVLEEIRGSGPTYDTGFLLRPVLSLSDVAEVVASDDGGVDGRHCGDL